ncbi:MAG: hypothetical protein NC428_11620, partial [Clostridium sp.]|nr:hypothetical protein [Clostridium sp.]
MRKRFMTFCLSLALVAVSFHMGTMTSYATEMENAEDVTVSETEETLITSEEVANEEVLTTFEETVDEEMLTTSERLSEVAIDETNFPDSTFREYVKQFDKDKNGSFSSDELVKVKFLYVDGETIASLKGVEYFTALTSLYCSNNQLTNMDV